MDSPRTPANADRAVHVRKKPRKQKVWPNLPKNFGPENQYEFRDQIASGGYAFVYSGYDNENHRHIAIKVPNTERAKAIDALRKERKFLQALYRGGAVVPEPIWFGGCGDRPVLVMELLGDCLGEIRKICGRQFTLPTILKLAVELIDSSEKVHDCGILHRDCKLKNYLLGPGNSGRVYLVDFGLSDRWLRNGEHIPFVKCLPPFGTMRYAPLAVHLGFEQGRKDDLEALGYMLIYLARGKLPWQSLWHEDKKIIWRDVGRMKSEIKLNVLCADLQPCFQEFMATLRNMRFEERPDYDALKGLFLDALAELGYDPDTPYDWESFKDSESDSEESLQEQMFV